MANPTTNYGWVLPTPTDLVTDLPADFDVALQGVDTTTKALNPSTTLGDLEYRSATANTNTRLGIGSTGNVLTVAGGVPTWAAPGSSSPASATATVATAQGTTSGSYTDLSTVGAEVTLTTGTKVLVILSTWIDGTGNVDFAISGATTRAASDTTSLQSSNVAPFRFSMARIFTVTAGSNTFTMKYKSTSGTTTFQNRQISVIDLGS
jgi:hypothetical protein